MPEVDFLKAAPVEREGQIITGNANPELAGAVAGILHHELTDVELGTFSDGEIKCRINDSVRGNHVFVMQSHGGGGMDPNVAIIEQLQLVNAATDGSAKHVIAVCPYLGYSRQDRKSSGREPISARLVCNWLAVSGATGMVAIDLHAGQIQGFFTGGPLDNLTAAPILREAIMPELEEGVVIVSPDAGRTKSAEGHKKRIDRERPDLDPGFAHIYKDHPTDKTNEVEALEVIGDVDGRQCLLVDDMIDTAGSLVAAAELLTQKGAKEVLAIATHAVLSGEAISKLGDSAIRKLVVTDTIALAEEKKTLSNLQIVSVAPLIAEAIYAIYTNGSISNIFDEHENIT